MKLQLFKKQNKIKLPSTRKKEYQLKWWHKLLFLSPIIVIALIFKGNEWYESYMLNNYKDSTWAVLTNVKLSGVKDVFDIENVAFEYNVGGKIYSSTISVPVNHKYVIGDLDLPLYVGQRYRLYFATKKADICKIDLTKPDTATIKKYINDVAFVIQKLLNNISTFNAQCISEKIFNNFSYDGLAYIIFYDEYLVENLKHNSSTFSSFWAKSQVKNIINDCLKQK